MHKICHSRCLQNSNLGLLLLRLAIGIVFVHAGWLKVTDMDMVVTGFASIGIPSALAYIVAYVELIGGIAIILGICVRVSGILLAIIMLVAILKVTWANGYGMQNMGYEYTLLLMLASLAIATLGAGAYSLGRLVGCKDCKCNGNCSGKCGCEGNKCSCKCC